MYIRMHVCYTFSLSLYIYIYICICMYAQITCVCVCVCVYLSLSISLSLSIYIYIYTYIYIINCTPPAYSTAVLRLFRLSGDGLCLAWPDGRTSAKQQRDDPSYRQDPHCKIRQPWLCQERVQCHYGTASYTVTLWCDVAQHAAMPAMRHATSIAASLHCGGGPVKQDWISG